MLLVTGITGHSGAYFLQELIDNNYKGDIRCLVRNTSNTKLIDNSGLNIEKVVGDLDDNSCINEIMNDVNVILHIYNIHHSPKIVQTAIKNNVERVILIHTTGIYSDFKRASQEYRNIENKVLKMVSDNYYKTRITILRPSMIYGDLCDSNMSKFIKMIDKLKFIPIINNGRNLIQPVNARDLGKAFYSVLLNPEKTAGNSYDLSGEKPIRLIEAFEIISKNINKKIFFINVPLWLGVFLSKIVKIITFGKINYIEKVQRMAEDRNYSHDNARRDFNFNPIVFEEGIKIEVKQYLEKGIKN